MREPTIAETVEWVGGASKQHLVQFIQACGSDAALVEAGIKGRAPLSKKVMKKKKHTVLQTEARKVLAAAWASAWSGAGGKGSSWSALDAKEGWLFKAGEKNSRLKRRHFRCEPGSKTIIYSAPVRGALPGKDDDLKVGKKKGEIDLRTAAQLIEGFNGQFLIATTTGRIFDLHVLPPSKAMDPHRTATLYAESAKWLRFLSEETGLNVYGWSDSPSEFPLIAACTRRESIALIKAAGGVLPGGQGAADAAAAAGRRRSELSIAPKLIPLPERVEEEEDDEREVLDGGGARAHLASPFARLSGRTVSPRLAIGSSDSAEPSTAAVLEGASSSAAASPSPSPSLAYLSPLNLEQYAPAFDDAGGDDPRDLLAMDAAALVAEFRMKKLHANRLRVWLDTLAAPESGGGGTAGGDSFTVGDDDALDSAQVDCDDAAEEGSGELAISDAPDVVLVGAQADSAEEEEKDGGELAIVGSDVGCDAPDTTAQADSADAAAVVAAEAEQEPAAPVLPSPADASGVASAEEGTASQLADDKAGASSAEVHVASEKAGGAGGLTIPLAVVIYGRDYGKRSACMDGTQSLKVPSHRFTNVITSRFVCFSVTTITSGTSRGINQRAMVRCAQRLPIVRFTTCSKRPRTALRRGVTGICCLQDFHQILRFASSLSTE